MPGLNAIKRNANGKIVPKKFAMQKLENARDMNCGFCLACGAKCEAVEPDARKYDCEACGLKFVYGAEEIAMLGLVKGGMN